MNPSRRTVQGAKDLLVETVGDPFPIRVAQMPKDKPIPIDPDIQGEVFACHDVAWWERRTVRSAEGEAQNKPMDLRIGSGFLQFQTAEEPMPLHHEDVLVGWKISDKFPTNLLRLLPAWISIRVVILLRKNNGHQFCSIYTPRRRSVLDQISLQAIADVPNMFLGALMDGMVPEEDNIILHELDIAGIGLLVVHLEPNVQIRNR